MRGYPRSSAPCWAAATLLVAIPLTLGLLYLGNRNTYVRTLALPGIQARYLFPVLTGAVVCAALTLRQAAGRFGRWLPLATALFAVLFQAAAALVVLAEEMSPTEPGRLARTVEGVHYVIAWFRTTKAVTTALLVGFCLASWPISSASSGSMDGRPVRCG